jgi:P4 family phage/plasmid primase-like protien
MVTDNETEEFIPDKKTSFFIKIDKNKKLLLELLSNLENIDFSKFNDFSNKFFGKELMKRSMIQKEKDGKVFFELTPFGKKLLDFLKQKIEAEQEEEEAWVIAGYYSSLFDEINELIDNKAYTELTEFITAEILKNENIYSIINDNNREMWIYKEGIYVSNGVSRIKKIIRFLLRSEYKLRLVNEIINKIETDTYIDESDFFSKGEINEIAVKNGILNLKTKELLPFSPDKIFLNKLSVNYDPKSKCPKIIEHLDTVLLSSDKKLILEMIGFCLYKKYIPEKAFMLIGEGRNGKSKTVELIKKLLGSENCVNIPLQRFEEDRFSYSELHTKMANLGTDISKRSLENTSIFKQLTGNDIISAPRKFLPDIHFMNYAKMIFCCNELPRTLEDSNAFFMRWIIINFPFTFVTDEEFDSIPENKRDKYKILKSDIMSELSTDDELSGLLNLALESLSNILIKGFSSSRVSAEVKKEWILLSDSFRAFLENYVELGSDDDYISKQDLRDKYFEFCSKNRLKKSGDRHIKSTITFFGGWDSRICSDQNYCYVWKGLRWKTKNRSEISIFEQAILDLLPCSVADLEKSFIDKSVLFAELEKMEGSGLIVRNNDEIMKS